MPFANLDNRIALVTGAASGLGRRLATDLFRDYGCRVRLVDRNEDGLRSTRDELAAIGDASRLSIHVADTTRDDDLARVAAEIGAEPLDILVNCAGVLYAGSFTGMPDGAFERVIDINLMGTVRVTRALLPLLMRSTAPRLVNIASAAGLAGAPGMCAYSTSKFGVVGFSEALRAEMDARLKITAVCPTLIRTNIVKGAAFPDGAEDVPGRMDRILARHGMPVEKASRLILRGVARGKRLVLIGADAHAMHFFHRFAPRVLEAVVRRLYRQMTERRILPS